MKIFSGSNRSLWNDGNLGVKMTSGVVLWPPMFRHGNGRDPDGSYQGYCVYVFYRCPVVDAFLALDLTICKEAAFMLKPIARAAASSAKSLAARIIYE